MALAMHVSTCLSLRGFNSAQRDRLLIGALVERMQVRVLRRPSLVCLDRWMTWVTAVRLVLHDVVTRG